MKQIKEANPTITTIELDATDNAAISTIQAHIKAEYPVFQRGKDVPKRAAISWALRKVAEDIAKWEEHRSN